MRKARLLVLGLALVALAMCILAGPGTRYGWWEWLGGIWLIRIAAWLGIAAAIASLVLIFTLAVPKWRFQPWVPIVSLCAALAAVAPPMIMMQRAKNVPPIHDVTTDLEDPPAFVALAEARNKGPNKAAYAGGATADHQKRAYRDIGPKVLDAPSKDAMQKAIDTARSMGWEVVASDTAAGRIEAVATSTWFGFKDDIVIRIRPNGPGSRIDVRSASRVGVSDIGANADRIRKYLSRL